VTPEAAYFLARAERTLTDAVRIAEVDIPHVAAREAYMAAFHAAQATIFERLAKVKTHRGVHSAFAQIARDDPGLGAELGSFLAAAYSFKDVADYGPRPATTDADEAERAIESARRLVERVRAALGGGPGDAG
jgi:uncharacterized protein (UPF0332 family)